MTSPKAHEVVERVERVEKAAEEYANRINIKSDDDDDIDPVLLEMFTHQRELAFSNGAHFGIRIALEMEEVSEVIAALKKGIELATDFECDVKDESVDIDFNFIRFMQMTEALARLEALKLLHVPSGEVEK